MTDGMDYVDIRVPGIPQPGGSKRAFVVNGRAVVTDDAKRNKPWRASVALAGREAMAGRPPFTGPLTVVMTFYMPRPKGHYGSGRNANKVKASAPRYPATKPDVLKLARSTEDALTGIVWPDDAATVGLQLYKYYADKCPPGVEIKVTQLEWMQTVKWEAWKPS